MKNVFLLAVLGVSLSACFSSSDGSSDEPAPKPPRSRGVFHPGPYTDHETGKTCNAPGGFCESDKRCHSSAEKCPYIR